MPRPKRVYCRDWKPQTRSIRGSVSLPRLQLTSDSRPFFECPTCFSSNDRLPICLWCKASSPKSAAAFWASMPKQRTMSAPVKIVVNVACGPVRTRSAETVSKPHDPGRPLKKVASPVSSRPSSPSNTFGGASPRTSITTADAKSNKLSLPMPDVVLPAAPPTPPEEGKFHTLPLRRKGHILRTTAGVVVNKSSRLSALFRKDAVPVLDKPAENQTPRKVKPRASGDAKSESRRRRPKQPLTTLPTIPSSKPLDVIPPSHTANSTAAYTMPTPPSFLSPFWYRPEEFGRLPASPPGSRATSLDTPRPPPPRGMHAHSLSEPVAAMEPPSGRPETWKRRMSGFFRHSVSVVTGQKAIH